MAATNGTPIPEAPPTDAEVEAEFAAAGLAVPSFQALMAPEVEIRGVRFTFRDMLSFDAYHLLERMRPGIGKAAASRAEDGGGTGSIVDRAAGSMIVLFGNLPPETVEIARVAMFQHTMFTRDTHPAPTTLYGNEQAAFDGLLPYHVYEINIRNYCRNFSESWVEFRSILPGAVVALLRSQLPTSQDSSSTPSTQD